MTASQASEEAGLHRLCALSELEDGLVREASVGRRRFGVVRLGERVFVFAGGCPHRGGPLARGRVRPTVTSDCPGEIKVDAARPIVTCPWHNWEYDLTTGHALFDRKLRLAVFKPELRNGSVFIRT